MGKFRELEEFEARFETLSVAELVRWRAYWVMHAENFAPKIRKEAMRRVHRIDKAIQQRRSEEST